MSETIAIPRLLYDEIIDHCLVAMPEEGCGLLGVADGTVTRVYPTANADRSPSSYTVPPEEHYQALVDAEARGLELGGVFHSHPGGDTRPSRRDLDHALDPTWVHLIVAPASDPELRGWSIREGRAAELSIRID